MTRWLALPLLFLFPTLGLAQAAPKGFAWKDFPDVGVSVQVPNGWYSRKVGGKGTKGLQITREKVTAKGFETGLTVNLMERATDAEMSAAILQMGAYMEKLHDSFSKIVESRITEQKGIPTMILEGVRTLPDAKERGPYHTRTIVHILKPSRRIYMVVFGSPANRWATDGKICEVMLNPIKLDSE